MATLKHASIDRYNRTTTVSPQTGQPTVILNSNGFSRGKHFHRCIHISLVFTTVTNPGSWINCVPTDPHIPRFQQFMKTWKSVPRWSTRTSELVRSFLWSGIPMLLIKRRLLHCSCTQVMQVQCRTANLADICLKLKLSAWTYLVHHNWNSLKYKTSEIHRIFI
jgi:hypothetical protein